jgi:aspartyl-tRNA synthetase
VLGRVRAANNAGIIVTALQVKSPAHAGMLIALGFDRGAY